MSEKETHHTTPQKQANETTKKSEPSNNKNIPEQEEHPDDIEEENKIITPSEWLSDLNKELLCMEKVKQSSSQLQCTYSKGYHAQEVYSCLTCYNETQKPCVICLACSFKCHDNHEWLNLYFKRNVKCDCGNNKFIPPCKICPDKDDENYENEYNHNYKGKYCYCDCEDKGTDMIQCFICEDWFHIEHTKLYGNSNNDNNWSKGEFICKHCFKDKFISIVENYNCHEFIIDDELGTTLSNIRDIGKIPNPYLAQLAGTPEKRKQNESLIRKGDGSECHIWINKIDNSKVIKDIIENNNDLIISTERLAKLLCHCDKCQTSYRESGMPFWCSKFFDYDWWDRLLYEDKINDELDESTDENKKIISDINNINMYQTKEIKGLDVEKQMELSMMNKWFYVKFKEYLQGWKEKADNKPVVVTEEHVKEFLKQMQSSWDK